VRSVTGGTARCKWRWKPIACGSAMEVETDDL
jgi:hypothetical protein